MHCFSVNCSGSILTRSIYDGYTNKMIAIITNTDPLDSSHTDKTHTTSTTDRSTTQIPTNEQESVGLESLRSRFGGQTEVIAISYYSTVSNDFGWSHSLFLYRAYCVTYQFNEFIEEHPEEHYYRLRMISDWPN